MQMSAKKMANHNLERKYQIDVIAGSTIWDAFKTVWKEFTCM